MIYVATRAGETPGTGIFEAATVKAAKARASRELEGGASPGQLITLRQMIRADEAWGGGWIEDGAAWWKVPGGPWHGNDD